MVVEDHAGEVLGQLLGGEAARLQVLGVPGGDLVGMVRGVFVDLEIGFGDAAQGVAVRFEEGPVGAEHAADAVLVDAGLGVGHLHEVELALDEEGPGVHVGGDVGVAAIDRLADEIERHDLPGDVLLRIDAGLGEVTEKAIFGGEPGSQVAMVLPFTSSILVTLEALEASRRWQPPWEPTNSLTSKPCSRGFSQSSSRPAPASALLVARAWISV